MIDPKAKRPKDIDYGPDAPVPIFQHRQEFGRLLALYRVKRPKRVLEIGTYHGGTLFHWLRNAPDEAIVVSVDHYVTGIDNRAMYEEWTPDLVELVVIDGDSRSESTVEEVRKHGPYDWVFIDAGHYYAEVASDWANYGAMVAKGGICALHDILPAPKDPSIEVDRLWAEIKAGSYTTKEIVADREADWGGIGIVEF